MTNSIELDTIYSFFNQYLFQEAKNSIKDIKYYFNTNPNTRNNILVNNLLEAIDTYDLEQLDYPLFQSIVAKSNKNEEEGNQIINSIKSWKTYSQEQLKPARNQLHDIISMSLLQRASNVYGNNPTEYVKYIKNSNLNISDTEVFKTFGFDEIDINTVVAESNTSYIKSSFNFINEVFYPVPGYLKAQMVIVCAASGVGKSLFSMTEAFTMAAQGHKVLYICLGDNNIRDFIIRMGAIYTGKSFAECAMDLVGTYKMLMDRVGGNLILSINKAGAVSASEIVDTVKKDDSIEVVVVDYDGNLQGVSEGESMYNTFGNVYVTLNELVLMGKLLFVCSQVKISAFDKSIIQMSDVGESSRKQHTADMIIGIGQEVDCPNNLHTIYISKNRRGSLRLAYTIRLDNGRFFEIPKPVYDDIKRGFDVKVNFDEGQLTRMCQAVLNSMKQVQTNINNVSASLSQRSPMAPQQPAGPVKNQGGGKNDPF